METTENKTIMEIEIQKLIELGKKIIEEVRKVYGSHYGWKNIIMNDKKYFYVYCAIDSNHNAINFDGFFQVAFFTDPHLTIPLSDFSADKINKKYLKHSQLLEEFILENKEEIKKQTAKEKELKILELQNQLAELTKSETL